MWIHFDLSCDGEIQRRLHKIFRREIKEWERRGIVKGAVLTYHFNTPSVPTDSLYVCLDIPTMKMPNERSVQLPNEAISQIPLEIITKVNELCSENQIKLGIIDFEYDIRKHVGKNYYRSAPAEEVLRFASIGTKIAFELLDMTENPVTTWSGCPKELANLILLRLQNELGGNYFWLREAFHFVCNPMLLDDSYLWTLAAL